MVHNINTRCLQIVTLSIATLVLPVFFFFPAFHRSLAVSPILFWGAFKLPNFPQRNRAEHFYLWTFSS